LPAAGLYFLPEDFLLPPEDFRVVDFFLVAMNASPGWESSRAYRVVATHRFRILARSGKTQIGIPCSAFTMV
jgi:hypothetical protein